MRVETFPCSRGPRRRIRLIAAAILAAAAIAESRAVDFPLRWRWSYPRPHGNNVVDMTYSPTRNLMVQVSERGQVYTSDDFELWIPRETGTTAHLRGVTFFNDRVVISGEAGTVLYADDLDDFRSGSLNGGPTADWLESVAASASLAVAVGDNGAVYTSPDGQTWTRQTSGTTEWLRSVVAGGSRFVAVGTQGTILTSNNGTNWTLRASGTAEDLNRVNFRNGIFLAVGDNGRVRSSLDGGISWRSVPSGAIRHLYGAASNGADWVLGGEEEVRLLDNNSLWYDELANPNGPPAWTYYSGFGVPSYFLIAGRSGMMAEGFQVSTFPYTWYPRSSLVRNWLFDVFWATNLFVAVGDRSTIMTSGSGVNWTLELAPNPATNSVFLGVGGTTNLLLTVGSQGTMLLSPNLLTNVVFTNQSGQVITQEVSTLGVLWNALEPRPETNDLQGVCYGHDLYCVTGDGGVIMTSADGTSWTRHPTPVTNLLSSVTAYPGGFVAVGDDGALVQSTNGATWTAVATQSTNWLYRVRYVNTLLVAVGQNGTILTSTDGLAWTARTSGTTLWLNDVTWLDGEFLVVGTQGTVLTSPDAAVWTNRGTITGKSLYAAANNGTRLVTVGIEGIVLRSPVVPEPDPVEILSYSRVTNLLAATVDNLFLFGGQPDQQFDLEYGTSVDGQATNAWRSGPRLEFFDASGTLFYLESLPLTNAPAQEFYRTSLVP